MARKVITVSYSLPPELAEKLESRAESVGISRSSYLTMLLSTVMLRPVVLEAVEKEALQSCIITGRYPVIMKGRAE